MRLPKPPEPNSSTAFNKWSGTGSISINYEQQVSTNFYGRLNAVRDQEVGGSNPLSWLSA
jgi:hypothetical protein